MPLPVTPSSSQGWKPGRARRASTASRIPSSRQDAIDFFTARFKRSDYNGDGKVDFTEDQAYCVDLVTLADTNKDGIVTRDEFLTAVAQ